eukprot:4224824-Karenia_brevis.AAC.1
MPAMQCGAVSQRGSDFAHHLVQTVMIYAAAMSMSVFALFLDLVKAFDRVVRELVLGWPPGCDDHLQHLLDLGLDLEAATFIYEYINEFGCLFEQWNVDPVVRDL